MGKSRDKLIKILNERMASAGWKPLRCLGGTRYYWISRGTYLELVAVKVVTSDRLMEILSDAEMPTYVIQFEEHIPRLMRFIERKVNGD